MSHADTHNILYPLQHGFHTGRSCETQLLEFIDDVTLNMENGKQGHGQFSSLMEQYQL
jgi:hypothetical protein